MSGDVRRRIGALERVAGDVGAESGDGEPIDLAALAEAVAVSIERYSSDSGSGSKPLATRKGLCVALAC